MRLNVAAIVGTVVLAGAVVSSEARAGNPWVLTEIIGNPSDAELPPATIDVSPEHGRITWTRDPNAAPHTSFVLSWHTRRLVRSASIKPGSVVKIKLTGAAEITSHDGATGAAVLDGILLIDGLWDRSQFGPRSRVACDQPNVCTQGTVVTEAIMEVRFPNGGEEFRFSFGMLNCGPCTTEYVFTRYLDEEDTDCGGRPATIFARDFPAGDPVEGTDGDDVILGTEHRDHLRGGDGDDVICGRGGNDFLLGEAGHDLILGGPGNDSMFGGSEADRLRGGFGEDFIHGDQGHDRIFGGPDADDLNGDTTFFDTEEEKWVSTQRGRDRIDGGSGDDLIRGGAGHDRLFGRRGEDRMFGNDEDDRTLDGVLSPNMPIDSGDRIEGGPDDDDLYGGYGPDLLNGGAGNDIVHGGPADDVVRGSTGIDSLHGGGGDDRCDYDAKLDSSAEDCELSLPDDQ